MNLHRIQATRKLVDIVVGIREPRAIDVAFALVPVSDRALTMTADALLTRTERRFEVRV